ncbi:DUF6952 family protein [Salibacter sp.]|jgi:hypothetical protein|uniref:DUF6952 family protein n=1 Tax=Salibacter sp. TaxID=2010995 RepID=UPI00286FB374|nr:hypothetical protein [Salibacter sp.]MDR9399193.1 hypothetical protein [Salibacter sp.]MDR9487920.1 hypothetical protein [Salibacter sp.]
MQVKVIKQLAKEYDIPQLKKAEEALLEEQIPEIEIEGEDEGEQLTHVMAAAWVIDFMAREGVSMGKAVREYTNKVRKSID